MTKMTDKAITPTSLLSELAVRHAGASRVFAKYGLDYCCHGRTPLATACANKSLDVATVLAELNQAVAGESDSEDRSEQPLPDLIEHILSRFHEDHRRELPRLLGMARKVEAVHRDKPSCPAGLADHLERVAGELESHMGKEEQVLFPAIRSGAIRVEAPVACMEQEHREHAVNLERLRELAHDYQPPEQACGTWRALYLGLAQLEQDLHQHIHLENNILFPRALAKGGDA